MQVSLKIQVSYVVCSGVEADHCSGSNGMMEALILWESIVNSQCECEQNIKLPH